MSINEKALFDTVRAIAGRPLRQDEVDAVNEAIGVVRAARQIGAAGLALIKEYEGLRLKAYADPVGILTVGYGHTGSDVKAGMVITEARADELLKADVAKFEEAVRALCPVTTQGQFDALVSFAFNVGDSALSGSTLRKKHVAGDYSGAADEFARWRFAGGKELAGLVKRRAAEAKLYRSAA